MVTVSERSVAGLNASWKDSYSFRAREMRMVFPAADHTGVSLPGVELVCSLLVEVSARKITEVPVQLAESAANVGGICPPTNAILMYGSLHGSYCVPYGHHPDPEIRGILVYRSWVVLHHWVGDIYLILCHYRLWEMLLQDIGIGKIAEFVS